MNVQIQDHANIQDKTLANSLAAFVTDLQAVARTNDPEIILDFKNTRFTYPLFISLLLLLRDSDPERFLFSGISSYMTTIRFPECVSVDDFLRMEEETSKTYLPVIRLDRKEYNEDSSQKVITRVAFLLKKQTQMSVSVYRGIDYILQETMDNFWEHSLATNAYVFCQAYPRQRFADIVIADNGIGLKGSYVNSSIPCKNDMQAMLMMVSAISSKDRPDNESRGYGLSTSRKMATTGLNGQFAAISGNAAYVKNKDKEVLFDLKDLSIKGTVVALRIYYDQPSFCLYNFIE